MFVFLLDFFLGNPHLVTIYGLQALIKNVYNYYCFPRQLGCITNDISLWRPIPDRQRENAENAGI